MTKKKRQVKLLAAIAALAVLALVYVLVSRADWNHEEDETTEEIEVLSVAPAEISEAEITNSYGTLYLSYDGETWISPDNPEMDLNQDALATLWNRLNPLSAVRDLGEAPEDLSATVLLIRLSRSGSSAMTVRNLLSLSAVRLRMEMCM